MNRNLSQIMPELNLAVFYRLLFELKGTNFNHVQKYEVPFKSVEPVGYTTGEKG